MNPTVITPTPFSKPAGTMTWTRSKASRTIISSGGGVAAFNAVAHLGGANPKD
jgi:hypothetical protein